MTNRLKHEKSPYLKQHENNPVDWYPWGAEAFARSKNENKPIVLSIGYSACHWCHVMAHECFENEAIAKIMNEHFINIKVDREERPDLDLIYQPVAQLITKGGGWPLTVFLTPELKPIYGGTYFPPADNYGRPGFPKLLNAISNMFQNDRPEAERRASEITHVIQNHEEFDVKNKITNEKLDQELSENTVIEALKRLMTNVDWENGGVGSAPKFPNASALTFLWRSSLAPFIPEDLRNTARDAVVLALTKMRRGGIYDQLGGGFSRYSVDGEWSVPHFEKMLYDNALLLKLYSEVLLNDERLDDFERKLFLDTIEKTIEYLKREMLSESGLFFTAQDADSEGVEGKFFVWTKAELGEILTAEENKIFSRIFGVTEAGNFEHGATVLFLANSEDELTPSEKAVLQSAKEKVWNVRELRIRPGLDDKILISWNALLLSGLSWASLVYEKENFHGLPDLKNVLTKAYTKIKELKPLFLDDFSFLSLMALDLARAFPLERGKFIEDAKNWSLEIKKEFEEEESIGFYFTAHSHEKLIHRPKSLYDQAIPSGTGISYGVMSVLTSFGETNFRDKVEQDFSALRGTLSEQSFGLSEVLSSLLLHTIGATTVSGEWNLKYRAHPFYFGSRVLTGKTQYCQNEVCRF